MLDTAAAVGSDSHSNVSKILTGSVLTLTVARKSDIIRLPKDKINANIHPESTVERIIGIVILNQQTKGFAPNVYQVFGTDIVDHLT